MRVTKRNSKPDEAEVMLSPLIDCVFLMLIFFLVTSMLKRFEQQIPVTLADPTAAVAVEAENDVFLLAIDRSGQVYREAGRDRKQHVRFEPVTGLPEFLHELVAEFGPDRPIEISVERATPFQRVINVLDVLQLQGLTNVRSRVRDQQL